jgi:hypothetical protein
MKKTLSLVAGIAFLGAVACAHEETQTKTEQAGKVGVTETPPIVSEPIHGTGGAGGGGGG